MISFFCSPNDSDYSDAWTVDTVTAAERQIVSQQAIREMHSERFYLVVDIPSNSIPIINGIKCWLGYEERISRSLSTNIHVNEPFTALVKQKFADNTSFSTQDLRIIKRYAKKMDATSESIAAAFKITKMTVETFNKKILKKAELFANKKFRTAKEAAVYFRDVGLI